MENQTITRALQLYGMTPERFLPSIAGYRNRSWPVETAGGEWINLILFKREPGILTRIRNSNVVSGYLYAHGFPARRLLNRKILQLHGGNTTQYGALYSYLPGHTIPWEAYTMDHIKALGMTMSHMHALLSTFPSHALVSIASEYQQITKHMEAYFAGRGVTQALRHKLGLKVAGGSIPLCHEVLKLCGQLSGQQALHMDFVRGNILFENATSSSVNGLQVGNIKVSGILDFEKTGRGHPILDIARTLAFLLVDCKYKAPRQIRKYFLRSGYNKRGRAAHQRLLVRDKNNVDVDILERLIDVFLLHDLYKFLRHNPYEFLWHNEHFVRTRNLLIERRTIAVTNDRMSGY